LPTNPGQRLSGRNNALAVFNSDGVKIHYDVAGNGNPVLFVHGFASNYKVNWGNTGWINTFIKRGRQVVALDLRGHGKSAKPMAPSDYHPLLMGGDALRLMDHLGIERADLIGYSMGAWISSHLMIAFPERLSAVVLGGIGDTFLATSDRSERIAGALTTTFSDAMTDPFLKAVRNFSELVGNDARALAACARGVYATGIPEFGRATLPVLIITGALDDVAGQPDRLTGLIPGAEKKIVPACDHLTALTRQAVKEEVLRFLDRHPWQ
jgi:pimeloyl-ACP methyl ester carboxylesterase